jgi:hypothetical protein
MPEPTHIQEFGNLRAVLNSDGRKSLFLPTGNNLWIAGKSPYPEIDIGGKFRKEVVNGNVFTSTRIVEWAKVVKGNLVIGTALNVGGKAIFYSPNGGANFFPSTIVDGGTVHHDWVKVIGDNIYIGGSLFRVSTDGGETFNLITDMTNLIGGIAFNGFDEYLALSAGGNGQTAFFPVGTSFNGVNFTNTFTPDYDHNQNGSTQTYTFGVEFYNNRYYRAYGPHQHNPSTDTQLYGGAFSSEHGTDWDEINFVPSGTFGIAPLEYVLNGPLMVIDTFLIGSPTKTNPYFRKLFVNTWDFDVAGEWLPDSAINPTADLIGGWITKAHGFRYWSGNNYQPDADPTVNNVVSYVSSDICISTALNPWAPYPLFTETEWNLSAKCVDDNDDLLVFERRNNSYGNPVEMAETTRLVKVVKDA